MRHLVVGICAIVGLCLSSEAGAQQCTCGTSGPTAGTLSATSNSTTSAVSGYNSSTGVGVGGTTTGGLVAVNAGVQGYASSTSGYGVYASNASTGTAGSASEGSGVYAATETVGGAGLYATSANGPAISANGQITASISGSSSIAVAGTGTSGAWGVGGQTDTSIGVNGYATALTGTTYGVYGTSKSSGGSAAGVYGLGNTGVAGQGVATGVYGGCSGTGCVAAYFSGSTNTTGCIEWNGTKEFGCTSDRRLKKNITPLTSALETLLRLKGVTYEWKKPEEEGNHATGRQTGFIAQDVEEVFPNWIDENRDGFKTLAIQPAHVTALEVEAIRSLKMQNDTLKMESDELRDRVKSLEAGRRPLVSGLGEGGIGLGLCVIAGALVVTRRRRSDEASH